MCVETCNFHLVVGKTSLTLGDVYHLLHDFTIACCWTISQFSRHEVVELLTNLIIYDGEEPILKCDTIKFAHGWFSFLKDRVHEAISQNTRHKGCWSHERHLWGICHHNVFGCKFFVLSNRKDNLGKFDVKGDEDICLRYSTSSKTFRVLNKRSLMIE